MFSANTFLIFVVITSFYGARGVFTDPSATVVNFDQQAFSLNWWISQSTNDFWVQIVAPDTPATYFAVGFGNDTKMFPAEVVMCSNDTYSMATVGYGPLQVPAQEFLATKEYTLENGTRYCTVSFGPAATYGVNSTALIWATGVHNVSLPNAYRKHLQKGALNYTFTPPPPGPPPPPVVYPPYTDPDARRVNFTSDFYLNWWVAGGELNLQVVSPIAPQTSTTKYYAVGISNKSKMFNADVLMCANQYVNTMVTTAYAPPSPAPTEFFYNKAYETYGGNQYCTASYVGGSFNPFNGSALSVLYAFGDVQLATTLTYSYHTARGFLLVDFNVANGQTQPPTIALSYMQLYVSFANALVGFNQSQFTEALRSDLQNKVEDINITSTDFLTNTVFLQLSMDDDEDTVLNVNAFLNGPNSTNVTSLYGGCNATITQVNWIAPAEYLYVNWGASSKQWKMPPTARVTTTLAFINNQSLSIPESNILDGIAGDMKVSRRTVSVEKLSNQNGTVSFFVTFTLPSNQQAQDIIAALRTPQPGSSLLATYGTLTFRDISVAWIGVSAPSVAPGTVTPWGTTLPPAPTMAPPPLTIAPMTFPPRVQPIGYINVSARFFKSVTPNQTLFFECLRADIDQRANFTMFSFNATNAVFLIQTYEVDKALEILYRGPVMNSITAHVFSSLVMTVLFVNSTGGVSPTLPSGNPSVWIVITMAPNIKCNITENCVVANTLSVFPSLTDGCICRCRNYWTGAQCQVCPQGYRGASCNQCPSNMIPTEDGSSCRTCSLATDCKSHATQVSPASDGVTCSCSCRNQWTGRSCSDCNMTKYFGEDCDRCAAGLYEYPVCRSQEVLDVTKAQNECVAKCVAINCKVGTVTVLQNQPICSCGTCTALTTTGVCGTLTDGTKVKCIQPTNKCVRLANQDQCAVKYSTAKGELTKYVPCGPC